MRSIVEMSGETIYIRVSVVDATRIILCKQIAKLCVRIARGCLRIVELCSRIADETIARILARGIVDAAACEGVVQGRTVIIEKIEVDAEDKVQDAAGAATGKPEQTGDHLTGKVDEESAENGIGDEACDEGDLNLSDNAQNTLEGTGDSLKRTRKRNAKATSSSAKDAGKDVEKRAGGRADVANAATSETA